MTSEDSARAYSGASLSLSLRVEKLVEEGLIEAGLGHVGDFQEDSGS